MHSFKILPNNALEATYHDPYNMIMNALLLSSNGYTITFDYMPNSHEAANMIVWYVVNPKANTPILVLEIK